MMAIGERIRRRRKQLGLSVDDIAKKLGKDRATIYRVELIVTISTSGNLASGPHAHSAS